MTTVVPTMVAAAGSTRLLADVHALGGWTASKHEPPALERLEAALGPDLAERLVTALSSEPLPWSGSHRPSDR